MGGLGCVCVSLLGIGWLVVVLTSLWNGKGGPSTYVSGGLNILFLIYFIMTLGMWEQVHDTAYRGRKHFL